MAQQRQRTIVRIKKGQRIILPSDATIVSVTNVNGGDAESLCPLPDPTPLVNYTFFFDRRADSGDTSVNIKKFILGNNSITWDPTPHQDWNLCDSDIFGLLKNVPGVAAVYGCCDCSAGSGCNSTLTLAIPASIDPPYFEVFVDSPSMDPWILRLDPIDPDDPVQVQREPCTTLL